MSNIKGMDELKDEQTILEVELTAADIGPFTPPLPDAVIERMADEGLLADVFGEVPPKDKIRFEDGDIGLERMADEAHQVWCMWMEYLFRQGLALLDGGFKIDAKLVKRWKRQMATPYAQLSEDEKKSDRDIARTYLNIAWAPENEEQELAHIREEIKETRKESGV